MKLADASHRRLVPRPAGRHPTALVGRQRLDRQLSSTSDRLFGDDGRFGAPPRDRAEDGRHGTLPDAVESAGAVHVSNTEAIISEVRKVERSEVERAADLFSARARAATREIEPLITKYSMKFMRPFKIASVLLVIAFVGWVVFQFIVQQSFYDWFGDRIDNLTD